MKILIVEDDVLIGNYIKYVLEKNRYTITGLIDNKEAVSKSIKTACPDVALLDIRLGNEESGIEIGELLSEAKIPFMYLTANNDRETMNLAIETNPVAYITKPFNEDNVVCAIELYRKKSAKS